METAVIRTMRGKIHQSESWKPDAKRHAIVSAAILSNVPMRRGWGRAISLISPPSVKDNSTDLPYREARATRATLGAMRGAWTLLLAASSFGQSPPHFEVAAIKPDAPGGVSTGNFQILQGGRLFAQKVLLRFFIQNAYGVRPFQISGGPDWINSEGYDIEAKAEGDPSPEEMHRMMQTLLEERFRLKMHRETKELPVYALTPAKGGLKLTDAKEIACIETEPTPCGRAIVSIGRMNGVQVRGGRVSMAEFIRVLSNLLGRAVIDRTDFTGMFDVGLTFALDDAIDGLPHPPGPPDETGQSIFVAVQSLGLKLESTKAPVEVLVIDHIERPSGN